MHLEAELSKNVPTDDLLLFGEATGMTRNDNLIAQQFKQDVSEYVSPIEAAVAQVNIRSRVIRIRSTIHLLHYNTRRQ